MGLTTPRVVHVTRSSAVVDEMGLVSFILLSPQGNLLIVTRRSQNWRQRWFHGRVMIQRLPRPTRTKRQRRRNTRRKKEKRNR